MNANDTVVGYLEVEGFQEMKGRIPIRVSHFPEDGKTTVDMGVMVLGGQNPRFQFKIKIKDNPF